MEAIKNLWNLVSETDPKYTKPVTFGRKFTSIDPYSQIKRATEVFGSAGTGWGWTVQRPIEYTTTNEIAILIRLWHGTRESYIEQWGQAGLYIDAKETKKDNDCFKKATTDGLTKCLSVLGFNSDVFLGKWEDSKYVQQMKSEFSDNPQLAPTDAVAPTVSQPEPPPPEKTEVKPVDEKSLIRLKWAEEKFGECESVTEVEELFTSNLRNINDTKNRDEKIYEKIMSLIEKKKESLNNV